MMFYGRPVTHWRLIKSAFAAILILLFFIVAWSMIEPMEQEMIERMMK